ncbi:uncharacterized protein LOC116179682 [Photinus pyralis]|uniref:uncharacterized protein LOC116166486 n=1 Tax=Photinus pyralis TaxID=7054 RepID=UPI001266E7AE|nr:uncharacterized protein LOC116166486 [Photinus pyralis]XP_031337306.1 uncharacterized protein LOC116166486 [Photinus pyralis]XP_031355356.1 uncharacterized protein LOC116179682 [Photinus pyralis]XP_031355357.1 uncharacterized protein LOC116179682 [Photinus pyralis]
MVVANCIPCILKDLVYVGSFFGIPCFVISCDHNYLYSKTDFHWSIRSVITSFAIAITLLIGTIYHARVSLSVTSKNENLVVWAFTCMHFLSYLRACITALTVLFYTKLIRACVAAINDWLKDWYDLTAEVTMTKSTVERLRLQIMAWLFGHFAIFGIYITNTEERNALLVIMDLVSFIIDTITILCFRYAGVIFFTIFYSHQQNFKVYFLKNTTLNNRTKEFVLFYTNLRRCLQSADKIFGPIVIIWLLTSMAINVINTFVLVMLLLGKIHFQPSVTVLPVYIPLILVFSAIAVMENLHRVVSL